MRHNLFIITEGNNMSEKEIKETQVEQLIEETVQQKPKSEGPKGEESVAPNTSAPKKQEGRTPEVNHPDDFYQQVLGSFKREEFSEEEINQRQEEWKKYEEPEQKSNDSKRVNDFPNYFFAGFWMRLFAYMVDLLCIGAISGITIDTVYKIGGWSSGTQPFGLYQLFSLAIYLGYFVLLTKFNHGQTIGKMIFGIRVVSFTEAELSWKTVLIRELCMRYVLQFNFFFYLGYLPVIFTKEKQHVGDFFSETSVVTINLIKAFNKQVDASL
jgi:uncharacterized RDD family membrane protein YckC